MRQSVRSELRGIVVGLVIAFVVVGLSGRWPAAQAASGSAQSEQAPGAEVPVPGGPGFVMISGVSFMPNSYLMQHDVHSDGSIYNNGSGAFFTAPVFLPHNAKVNKMTIYYYDNDSTEYARVRLLRTVQNSTIITDMVELTTGTSAAVDGYVSKSNSVIESPVVDLQSSAYLLYMYLPDTTVTAALRMRAVRIDYEMNAVMPLIQR